MLPFVRGAVQRGAPGVGLRIRVETQVEQHLHGFERLLSRPLVSDPLHPADSGGHLQRRHMQRRLDLRIGAVGQQKLHQDDVAGLGRAQESRRAVLIQPLIGENRAGLRAVLHAGIHIGALCPAGA